MFNKLKERLRQLDARQQQPGYPLTTDTTGHTCPHCQTEYAGRFCPQCGMEHDTARFTASNILRMVLDVMGYDESGNHSIARTLRDLFWRPGYMIRDFLGGHRVAYFQPFKLLVFLSIVFTLLLYVMGVEVTHESMVADMMSRMLEEDDIALHKEMVPLLQGIKSVAEWLAAHREYSIIFQNIFVVTATWKVYRRRVPYSWSETFVAQMFFCCQFLVLAIVELLLTWRYQPSGVFPYFVSKWVVLPVMLYDYFQLYGEQRFWPALWRFVKVELWIFLQYLLLLLLFMIVLVAYLVAQA